MGGWFLDVYVTYAIKSLVRFLRMRGSNRWPVTTATVSSASWALGAFGCSVAEVVYTYSVGGSVYGNANEKPFISPSLAEQ